MIVSLVNFEPYHIDLIDLKEGQNFVSSNKELVAAQAKNNLAMTMVIDGRIIGCGGVVRMWDGVGEVWLVVGDCLPDYQIMVCKTAKNFIKLIDPIYHRLQMAVNINNPEAAKFAEYLGFINPYLMREYDSLKQDYFLYERLRGENG